MICKVAGLRCIIKGQDVYLEAQERRVGRIMLRACFWKADLEMTEKSNRVGQ